MGRPLPTLFLAPAALALATWLGCDGPRRQAVRTAPSTAPARARPGDEVLVDTPPVGAGVPSTRGGKAAPVLD